VAPAITQSVWSRWSRSLELRVLAPLDYFGDDSSYRHPGSDKLVAAAHAPLKG